MSLTIHFSLLQTDPSAPATGSVADSIASWAERSVEVIGSYPFAGELWQLAYASSIIFVQWLYEQWAVVAVALLASAASLVLLHRRLDDGTVPERLIQSRCLAVGTLLLGVVGVWAASLLGVVLGSTLGAPMLFGLALPPLVGAILSVGVAMALKSGIEYRSEQFIGVGFALTSLAGQSWGAVLGLWLSVFTAAVFGRFVGPTAVRCVRRGIRQVAGSDARLMAAFVILQRVLAGLSVVGAGLVVIYAIAGVANGEWQAVLGAAATAPPETQSCSVPAT